MADLYKRSINTRASKSGRVRDGALSIAVWPQTNSKGPDRRTDVLCTVSAVDLMVENDVFSCFFIALFAGSGSWVRDSRHIYNLQIV